MMHPVYSDLVLLADQSNVSNYAFTAKTRGEHLKETLWQNKTAHMSSTCNPASIGGVPAGNPQNSPFVMEHTRQEAWA
jgi:hypothetical protein